MLNSPVQSQTTRRFTKTAVRSRNYTIWFVTCQFSATFKILIISRPWSGLGNCALNWWESSNDCFSIFHSPRSIPPRRTMDSGGDSLLHSFKTLLGIPMFARIVSKKLKTLRVRKVHLLNFPEKKQNVKVLLMLRTSRMCGEERWGGLFPSQPISSLILLESNFKFYFELSM